MVDRIEQEEYPWCQLGVSGLTRCHVFTAKRTELISYSHNMRQIFFSQECYTNFSIGVIYDTTCYLSANNLKNRRSILQNENVKPKKSLKNVNNVNGGYLDITLFHLSGCGRRFSNLFFIEVIAGKKYKITTRTIEYSTLQITFNPCLY